MNLKQQNNFLKNLPKKLNQFYSKNSKSGFKVSNKSKTKKDFDPVTNIDRGFEKYIRSLIHKSFPKDSIIGEEFEDKYASNDYQWCIDPIDGTRAFVIGAPTWSNLIGFSVKGKSTIGLANFPELNKYYLSNEKKSFVIKNSKTNILKSSKNNDLKTIKIMGNFHGTLSYEKQKKIIYLAKGLSNLRILLCSFWFPVAKIFPPVSAGSFFQFVTMAPEFLMIGMRGKIS